MRLWSIHPKYLDSKGLVALWREGLLAQKVLLGQTKGYKHHPQLIRFKDTDNPLGAIAVYLISVMDEADRRGYRFDGTRIIDNRCHKKIPVTNGQLRYEFEHLLNKLKKRDPAWLLQFKAHKNIVTHPMFEAVNGTIESWERI